MINYTCDLRNMLEHFDDELKELQTKEDYIIRVLDYLNNEENCMKYKTALLRVLYRVYGEQLTVQEICDKVKEKINNISKPNNFYQTYIEQYLDPGAYKKSVIPSQRPQEREQIFILGIVLGLELEDVYILMRKGLWEQEIIYSDYKEIIGAYCVLNKHSYNTYLELIDTFELKAQRLGLENNPMESVWLEHILEEGLSTEKFMEVLISNAASFKGYSKTTLNSFYALWRDIKNLYVEVGRDRYQLWAFMEKNMRNNEKEKTEAGDTVADLKRFANSYLSVWTQCEIELKCIKQNLRELKERRRFVLEEEAKVRDAKLKIIIKPYLEDEVDKKEFLSSVEKFLKKYRLMQKSDIDKFFNEVECLDKKRFVKSIETKYKKLRNQWIKREVDYVNPKQMTFWNRLFDKYEKYNREPKGILKYVEEDLCGGKVKEYYDWVASVEKQKHEETHIFKEADIDYGIVRNRIKQTYKRYRTEISEHDMFNEILENAFRKTSQKEILSYINSNLLVPEKREPISLNQKHKKVERQNSDIVIPRELTNMAISQSRISLLLRAKSRYRKYFEVLDSWMREPTQDKEKDLIQLRRHLPTPTRKDFLLLAYFKATLVYENEMDDKKFCRYNGEVMAIDNYFEDVANEYLQRAGFEKVHLGSVIDAILILSLRSKRQNEADEEERMEFDYSDHILFASGECVEEG